MKRSKLSLFSMLFATLAFGLLSACTPDEKPDNPDNPDNPEQPENPDNPDNPDKPADDAKEEVTVTSNDFTISIHDITDCSAIYDLDPKDDGMMYIHFLEVKRKLDGERVQSDEEIFAYDMLYFENMAHAKGITVAEAVEGYAKKGDLKGLPLDALVSSTEYLMYAYGVEIQGGEVKRVTEVTRCPFLTFSVEKNDAVFTLKYKIDGPVAEMFVDPGDYKGGYYFDYVEGSHSAEDVEYMAGEVWSKIYDMMTHLGYAPEDIVNEGCSFGKDSYAWELSSDTEYTGFAFAVNEKAQLSSKVSYSTFRTEKVEPSDNVITISIENLTYKGADVRFTTTNDDPYAALVFRSEDLKGMSESEVLSYCAYDLQPPTFVGSRVENLTALEEQKEYTAVAFGLWGGEVTTGLFRVDFKTPAFTPGAYTIHAEFDDYYDIAAISELDERWIGFDQVADAVLPVQIITEPADADKYYFGIYMLYEGDPLTAEIAKDLMLQQGYKNVKKDAYWLLYDVKYCAVAMIEDGKGDLSEVWFSKEFTLTKDGAGDPQIFVDSEYNDFDLTSASMAR